MGRSTFPCSNTRTQVHYITLHCKAKYEETRLVCQANTEDRNLLSTRSPMLAPKHIQVTSLMEHAQGDQRERYCMRAMPCPSCRPMQSPIPTANATIKMGSTRCTLLGFHSDQRTPHLSLSLYAPQSKRCPCGILLSSGPLP